MPILFFYIMQAEAHEDALVPCLISGFFYSRKSVLHPRHRTKFTLSALRRTHDYTPLTLKALSLNNMASITELRPMSPNSAISSPPTPGIASGTHTPVGHRMVAAKKADGYRLFSDFISSDPLRSTTIFRRFDRLAMRNLLYLESELAALESEVERLDMDLIPETMINHLGDWTILKAEAEYAEEDASENISEEEARKQELMIARMRLVKRIRVKVREYHEALKLMTEILALERPEHDDIETNGRIFVQPDEDDYDHDHWQDKAESHAIIQGAMSLHLCDEYRKDLCTLAPQVERDPLTRLVESKHQLRSMIKDKTTGMTSLSKWKQLNKVITWISVFLVVVWLVGAIVGLYFWKSNHGRLGLLSVLTLGFAFSVLWLTTARRHDVFASTAAYAAVLVVFIGSTLQSAEPPQSQANSTSSKVLTRNSQPTRAYLASGFEVDYTSDTTYAITLVGGMLVVASVLLCAVLFLQLRRRGRIRL
ncbi:hypothetical protein QM012_001891 [Aureobasidium pullulans]|uniref:DUF6594 domain-containing protein n=1 Tax=Aureobasidium pullulans TaxID=5580 RepID=A0ABR0TCT3_AURPU